MKYFTVKRDTFSVNEFLKDLGHEKMEIVSVFKVSEQELGVVAKEKKDLNYITLLIIIGILGALSGYLNQIL